MFNRSLLASVLALAGGHSSASAGEPWNGATELHDLTFPESNCIHNAVFPPGTGTVYVQLQPTVLNLWEAGVNYWPELLGAVGGVIVLVCVLLTVRIARRPRRIGEWHCRRCGYCLSGAQNPLTATCPECSVSAQKKHPRLGRARWKRALPLVLIAVALLLGYGGMHVANVPRDGWLARRYVVRWDRLQREAESRNWTQLLQFSRPLHRVIEVDIVSGRTTRVICEGHVPRHALLAWPLHVRLSDDGRDLFTMDAEGGLVCRSAQRGVTFPTNSGHSRRGYLRVASNSSGLM